MFKPSAATKFDSPILMRPRLDQGDKSKRLIHTVGASSRGESGSHDEGNPFRPLYVWDAFIYPFLR